MDTKIDDALLIKERIVKMVFELNDDDIEFLNIIYAIVNRHVFLYE